MRTLSVILLAAAAGYLAGARDGREAILQADRDFDLAVSQRGVDAWTAAFAEDGAMSKSDGTVVRGRDAIRALMAPMFAEKETSLRWKPDFAEMARSGELGYTTGPAKLRGKNAQGQTVERDSRYLTVWKKQKDGTWKVAFDLGTGGQARVVSAP